MHQPMLSDVEHGEMMLACEIANGLGLAVYELGAQLDWDLEVGLVSCEDPPAETRAGLEDDDATAGTAKPRRGGKTARSCADYCGVEGSHRPTG